LPGAKLRQFDRKGNSWLSKCDKFPVLLSPLSGAAFRQNDFAAPKSHYLIRLFLFLLQHN